MAWLRYNLQHTLCINQIPGFNVHRDFNRQYFLHRTMQTFYAIMQTKMHQLLCPVPVTSPFQKNSLFISMRRILQTCVCVCGITFPHVYPGI